MTGLLFFAKYSTVTVVRCEWNFKQVKKCVHSVTDGEFIVHAAAVVELLCSFHYTQSCCY
jgi:hypothetical protein